MKFFMTFFVAVLWAQAQGTSTQNPSNSTSSSNANNVTNVYGGAAGNGGGRGFAGEALPGMVGSFPFQGIPVANGEARLYCPAAMRGKSMTVAQLQSLASGAKRNKIWVSLANAEREEPTAITFACYWPHNIAYTSDLMYGEVTGSGGKDEEPSLTYMAATLLKAVKASKATRYAVVIQDRNRLVTGAGGIGAGASLSRMLQPAIGNDPLSGSLGLGWGKTTTEIKGRWFITVIPMNAGSVDPPALPAQPQASQTVPPPATTQSSKPQDVTVRVVVEKPQVEGWPTSPASLSVSKPDACDSLQEFAIYFDFKSATVKSSYLLRIKQFADWLKAHPSCTVQVEGHTDAVGTATFNAGLGRQRGLAVYNRLINEGVSIKQVGQFVSVSKDRPASLGDAVANRRVVIRPIGLASH